MADAPHGRMEQGIGKRLGGTSRFAFNSAPIFMFGKAGACRASATKETHSLYIFNRHW